MYIDMHDIIFCPSAICFKPSGCLNGGFCSSPGHCSCGTGWEGLQCGQGTKHVSIVSVYTSLHYLYISILIAICTHECNRHGTCVRPGKCVCNFGWEGELCDQGTYSSQPCLWFAQLKTCASNLPTAVCLPPCANGGTCILPGHCACPLGWEGSRCEE